MRILKSHLLPGCLGSGILLALLLAGCGASSTGAAGPAPATTSSPASGQPTPTSSASPTPAGASSGTPQLACVLENVVQPVDTVRETLHCTVARAASSETAFALHYTIANNTGGPEIIAPTCRGALSGGKGSCTVTFSVMVLLAVSRGTVTGATEPDRYPLGPVVPRQESGTPTGLPKPPLLFQAPPV
jgi:hypothetical protein